MNWKLGRCSARSRMFLTIGSISVMRQSQYGKSDNNMKLINDYEWRPITFQGVLFPPELMAITVVECLFENEDEKLSEWLWRIRTCCGCTRSADAKWCADSARKVINLLLDNPERARAKIVEVGSNDGFEPEKTYQSWLSSMARIAALADLAAEGECSWSAPSHPLDKDPH